MKKTPSCIYNALSKQAFTLIEVTLALGVAGFCLVSIFGLLPIGINSNQVSLEQTVAGNIASSILSDLRSTPVTAPATSSHYGIPLPTPGKSTSTMGPSTSPATIFLAADGSAGASGELVTSGSAISRYRVTIGFAFPVPQVPQVVSALPPPCASWSHGRLSARGPAGPGPLISPDRTRLTQHWTVTEDAFP